MNFTSRFSRGEHETTGSRARGPLPRLVRSAVLGLALLAGLLATLGAAAQPAMATCEFPRSISISDVRRYEGTGGGTTSFRFKVRSRDCPNATTVKYQTSGLPLFGATAPGDYTGTSGTLIWAAGDSSDREITVPVVRDTLDEVNEAFVVTLSNNTGWSSIDDAVGVGTILDDDGPLKWNADDASCPEADPVGSAVWTTCHVRVTTSRAFPGTATVHVTTSNGTAITPLDYAALNQPLTLANPAQSGTIKLLIRRDNLCEGNETLTVKLSSPSTGVVADDMATVTIADDDIFC